MIEDLKIVNIGHYINRTGTLFLHSLLDNHPQILSIPGVINLKKILKHKVNSPKQALELFESENPKFFDTSTFSSTDINNSRLFFLGEKKNDRILTNKEIFRASFLQFFSSNLKITKKKIILAIYFAYAKSHDKNIENKKILLLHPHEQNICVEFNRIFPFSKFLIPIRNPVKTYYSLIETRRIKCNLRNQKYYPRNSLIEFVNGLNNFRKNKFDMMIIRLEDLGKNTEKEMRKISEYININFDITSLQSTFGGYKYWGNTINLQRNKFEEKDYTSYKKANKIDLSILELLNIGIIKEFYNENNTHLKKRYGFYKILLPLEDELRFLKNFSVKYLFSYVKFIILYFPKRIFLIFKLMQI